MQRRAGVVNRHAPVQARTAVQGDGAHMSLIEVLVYLEQAGIVIDPGTQRLVQGWQRIAGDYRYRAVNLCNLANGYLSSLLAC
jgi:hypothetical protein